MNEEMEQIKAKGLLQLVEAPVRCMPINNRWIYLKKTDSSGNIVRYRARSVAKGYSQRAGIDYDQGFSPVAKCTTLRLLLALVAHRDYSMIPLDFKAAFLTGTLEEEL